MKKQKRVLMFAKVGGENISLRKKATFDMESRVVIFPAKVWKKHVDWS